MIVALISSLFIASCIGLICSSSIPHAPKIVRKTSTKEMGTLGINMEELRELSMDSCNGCPSSEGCNFKWQPTTVPELIDSINKIFKKIAANRWDDRKQAILKLLKNFNASPCELCKYTYFDKRYPYTRNLISTDDENYTLLLLCWNPGMESKIHDHPCDGCFVKGIKGKAKETKYKVQPEIGKLKVMEESVFTSGDVTYMDDFVGLHKIGCEGEQGAVTLHLYTPPYMKCKVWANDDYNSSFEGKMSYYSEYTVLNSAAGEGVPDWYI